MPQSRLFAAYLSLSTAAGIIVGVPFSVHEAEAAATARRAAKQVRRTASAPSNANAPNEALTSSAAATDGAAPAPPKSSAIAPSNATPEEKQSALSGRRNRETGAPARARRLDSLPSSGRGSDATREGTPAKGTPEPGTAAKGPAPEAARPLEAGSNPASASTRAADVRASVAKGPAEAPSTLKSTAEKFAAEPPSDVGDSARPTTDLSGPSARRELPPSSVASARSVIVSLEGPVFDGGDVPRAAAALERMKGAFTRCASTETALTKSEGSIDLRFLVRAPGRAEGVDIDKTRGLSGDVVRCMTSVLARSYVGAPSDDPVGVAITVRVRKD